MAGTFRPQGKNFDQRLAAFLADVKSLYHLDLRRDSGQTIAWQQKYHVAHMFLHNAYRTTKPTRTDSGKRTIAWSHFSDPKIVWHSVAWSEFLRTARNTGLRMAKRP